MTSGVGYVRLHGRNPNNSLGGFDRDAQRTRQHDYLYSETELAEWTARIEHINRFADATFVVFNNDAGAKSVVNALQLKASMNGVYAKAPLELRRKYPMELERFNGEALRQVLFSAA